jgi:hypothetical protein
MPGVWNILSTSQRRAVGSGSPFQISTPQAGSWLAPGIRWYEDAPVLYEGPGHSGKVIRVLITTLRKRENKEGEKHDAEV